MEFEKEIAGRARTLEQVGPMVAILTGIAIHNPRTFPVYVSILSRMLSWVSRSEGELLLKSIWAKFEAVPHTGQLEIWMQRFTARSGLSGNYSEPLCRAVIDPEFQLWNNEWLTENCREFLQASTYFDQAVFDALGPVVQSDEVQLFRYGG